MAQGDLVLFDDFTLTIADGTHDMDAGTYTVALLSDVIGTGINASDAGPDFGDYTEVATGDGYTSPGAVITCTYTGSSPSTFAVTSGDTTWTQNGAGPTNINTALIYDDLLAGNNAVGFVEMRDGGTTAISLQDGNITITWNPTIFTTAKA